MNRALEQQVRRRARGLCEYCRIPQQYDEARFEVEHTIARQHGGHTVAANLAVACFSCNRHKGPNLTGIDAKTRRLTRLFHPRRMKWARHFRWDGPVLTGRTAVGRTTIAVPEINHPLRVRLREELIEEGVFPAR